MTLRLVRALVWGLSLMLLGNGWCRAQSSCTNRYVVQGVDRSGQPAPSVTFNLRRFNVDYDAAKKKTDTDAQVSLMGPGCQLIGQASCRQNCAGFVLQKLWNIGVYNTDASAIHQMVRTFGDQVGVRLGPHSTVLADLSTVQQGDVVVYGDAAHVAYVVSAGNGIVTIEGKDNEGAYFRYGNGQESAAAKTKWGSPTFWHLDRGRILSHAKVDILDTCPSQPAYKFTCPSAQSVDCIHQVPPPDTKAVEKQLVACRGSLTAGYVWVSQWMADVKAKDTDDGGAGSPRKITRTYTATVFCEKQTGMDSYGLEAYPVPSCTQEITVADKTAPEFPALRPLSVECERDIPTPQPGYRETASDNCGGEVQTRHAGDTLVSGVGCKGNPKIIRRTFQARDAAGNVGQAVQMIRVENTSPPRIVSGQSELNLLQGQPIPPPDTRSIVAVDVCTGENMNIAWLKDQVARQGSGRTGDPLIKKRTYRVSDSCGNYMDLVQTIRAEGGAPPAAAGNWSGQWVDSGGTVVTITTSGDRIRMTYTWREVDDGKPYPHKADGKYEGTVRGNEARCAFTEEYTDHDKDWHRKGSGVLTLDGDTIHGVLTLPQGQTTGTWHIPIDPNNPPLTPKSGDFPFTWTRKR